MTEPTISQTVIGDHNIFTAQGDIRIVYELPPAETEDHRNLIILLNKVRQFWVEGVLEQSVHHEALIQLGKESRPEMVEHPWGRVIELPNQDGCQLSPDKKIDEIFEETGRALLIVGEPGSGKTFTLLELARELIIKAEGNPTMPIPVVFNLSTWTDKDPAIFDWLVNELSAKYQVSKGLGRTWIKKRRLTLLLDGLDEVAPEDRAACVTAINKFFDEYGLPGLVACSRLQEYLALPKYLKLSGAICLQPLTRFQVEDYLQKAGPKLASLQTVLGDDPALLELAETPLMLSVMSVAYQDLPVEALLQEEPETLEGRRQHLFDFYIASIFRRRGKADQPYTRPQVISWLRWLAQRMTQHSISIFFIEELQPSWLATRNELRFFKLWYCLLPGLFYILWFTFFSISRGVIPTFIVFYSAIIMIITIAFFVAIYGRKLRWSIKPVEKLSWSLSNFKLNIKSIYFIIPILLIIFIFFSIQLSLKEGLPVLFYYTPVFLFLLGIRKVLVDKKVMPNQGIRMSLNNTLFIIIVFPLLSLIGLFVIIIIFGKSVYYGVIPFLFYTLLFGSVLSG